MTSGRPDVLDPSSGSRRVVDLLASTATVLVIHALGDRRLRYSQIGQRVPGVPQQTLTGTLRELVRHGLVEVVPDGDGYQLTGLGRSLLDQVVTPFCAWTLAHADEVRPSAARPSGGGCAPPTS